MEYFNSEVLRSVAGFMAAVGGNWHSKAGKSRAGWIEGIGQKLTFARVGADACVRPASKASVPLSRQPKVGGFCFFRIVPS